MQPKITVYIPSHNYGRYLGDAVESVLKQSLDDWELIIIDDNSSDNTSEVIALYEGDSRIRSIKTEGIGLHGCCNLALREARGQYLLRLDADDILSPEIFLVLSHYLDTHQDVALVFPDYYLMDEFGTVFSHEKRQRLYHESHAFDLPPNGACFLARVGTLKEVGGYRDDLKAQDGYHIWTKLMKAHRCANVNLPLYYYRRHGSNLTNTAQRIIEARRQIKRETILTQLQDFKPFTAVIPCRRSYDCIPNLWQERMGEKNLLERAIETACQSTVLDNIIVACDNPEAEESMRKFNDPRLKFFLRDKRDTIRSESIVPSLEKITRSLSPELAGITVLCYVQAPFVTADTLEEAIFTLVMNDCDSSFGVEEVHTPLFRRSRFGLEAINRQGSITSDSDMVYSEARSVLASKSSNFRTGSLVGTRIVNFVTSQNESFFIDSAKNLQIAKILDAQRRVFGGMKEATQSKVQDDSASAADVMQSSPLKH